MTAYQAPTRDMKFVIQELLDLDAVTSIPDFQEATPDLIDAILDEASKFAGGVLDPLNRVGDEHGTVCENGEVRTAPGFPDAYRQYVDGGWNSLPAPVEFGGQGLPALVATAAQEMWQSANMAFSLCPVLSAGAVAALHLHGTREQQDLYLPKLVSGEWTGTMNLTEPQAGSDLSAVRTRAERQDGHYLIQGQKIFITWGEHDCAENIIHLVLARTPDAPEGVKGISLFIVPKFLPDADGNPGKRNDLRCVSVEHKLGIHGSPTCTMAYGDQGGAVGYLVGEEGMGLAYMFTMMNEARHMVGVQGLSIAERAYQQAVDYARERVQGRPAGQRGGERVSIIHHPDVRRMLLTMRSQIEAMRALCYDAARSMDLAGHHPDESVRRRHQARADLLIPVVKGWCTDLGVDVASTGIQVHGGMGYIEETGAAQHLRDARIAPIYEGTNGIQAGDLTGRKVARDRGRAMYAELDNLDALCASLESASDPDIRRIHQGLVAGVADLREATDWIVNTAEQDPAAVAAASVPYLTLAGHVFGGGLMARAAVTARKALESGTSEVPFYKAKCLTARFYAEQMLPRARGLLPAITSGGDSVMAMDAESF